jgi:TRAP-type uncharacterized transport system substrate-binding protein
MKKVLFIAAIATALSMVATTASADLSAKMKKAAKADITMKVACGSAGKANCNTVVPRLSAETTVAGVNLVAETSKGSVESGIGVCLGPDFVEAAVGQRDAFDYVTKTSPTVDRNLPDEGCANKFQTVGNPVYPYFGYLIARNDTAYKTLQDMVKSAKPGKFIEISAGELGNGGQITMANIMKGNPEWKTAIHVASLDKNESLRALDSGKIDAYFLMDGPNSDTIAAIRDMKNKDTNEPLYKFIEINLSSKFYANAKDWNGQPLYYQEEIYIPGVLNFNKPTIATDAVLIVGSKYYNANKPAMATLTDATDKAQSPIRSDLSVPKGWKASGR